MKKKAIKERPNKYVLKYNLSIKEIAAIFGVVPSTITRWINDPAKKEWLEQKLKIKGVKIK